MPTQVTQALKSSWCTIAPRTHSTGLPVSPHEDRPVLTGRDSHRNHSCDFTHWRFNSIHSSSFASTALMTSSRTLRVESKRRLLAGGYPCQPPRKTPVWSDASPWTSSSTASTAPNRLRGVTQGSSAPQLCSDEAFGFDRGVDPPPPHLPSLPHSSFLPLLTLLFPQMPNANPFSPGLAETLRSSMERRDKPNSPTQISSGCIERATRTEIRCPFRSPRCVQKQGRPRPLRETKTE